MPLYKNCGGVPTKSPIYDYSTGNGGSKPPLHRGEYPAHVITHKHPAPRGERAYYEDRSPSVYSESGANFRRKQGRPEAPGVTTSKAGVPANRGIKRGFNQNRFSQRANRQG